MIFVILTIPTALVHNFAGFLMLRFWGGFFGMRFPKQYLFRNTKYSFIGSLCLATGAAAFQDMYPMIKMPYSLAL